MFENTTQLITRNGAIEADADFLRTNPQIKPKINILVGDARDVLRELPNNYFRTCVTSPPYWGLRDYVTDNQIGAEMDMRDYIRHLVDVFREVRRTLTDDGTFWLNIGDSYTSGGRSWRGPDTKNQARGMSYRAPTPEGLKPKDLVGIPWRVAFALQDDGWYLRADNIWYKPNCQPESVKDRPTRSHEYLFLFTKSERYFYDYEVVKEPTSNGFKRNLRTVWQINTAPFAGAHFAVFPPALVEPCITAGSRPDDNILDPFFGSGTVGLVCQRLQRNCTGIELNENYAQIARERLGLI